MKTFLFTAILFTFLLLESCGQDHRFKIEVKNFQDELNEHYSNPETSPLLEEELKTFTGLSFFEPDEKYRVEAEFKRVSAGIIEIPTTTGRVARYQKYGRLTFELEGEQHELTVYRNIAFPSNKKVSDAVPLFLPYTDLTNGEETYGGGRYIDLEDQEGSVWVLDFNQSYNPYCAYNDKYSCPIPPAENQLNIPIRAGVKYVH